MKKFYIGIIVIFCITVGIGLYCRRQYTHVDFSDSDSLVEAGFSVPFFEIGDFVKEEEEEEYAEFNPEDYGLDSSVDIEILESDDTEEEEEVELFGKEGILEKISNAQYIILGKSLNEVESLDGALQQKIYVSEVIKGDEQWKGESISLINTDEIVWVDKTILLPSMVNLMKKDETYLVFMNPVEYKGKELKNIFYLVNDGKTIPYLNIRDVDNKIVEPEIVDGFPVIWYEDVKDNEFFVADNEALQNLLDIKREVLKKYNISESEDFE